MSNGWVNVPPTFGGGSIHGGFFGPSKGQVFHVMPYSGSDGNRGVSVNAPMKTLTKALSRATADQNDVVLMYAESNTAASTTDYQLVQLDWAKDAVHLIGVNAGGFMSQRSRIAAISSWTSALPLFKLSANNCLISGIEMFFGVANTTGLGCATVTGQRNKLYNCQISGIGALTNDINGSYSLYLNGAAENILERCTIGLDTIVRTVATGTEILIDNSAVRNEFLDCRILSAIGHSTQHPQVYLGSATAIDRWAMFKYCQFVNFSVNFGFAQTYVIAEAAALTSGSVLVHHCAAFGATNFAAASKQVQIVNSPINTAYTGGTGYKA